MMNCYTVNRCRHVLCPFFVILSRLGNFVLVIVGTFTNPFPVLV
jgi:hypothetical protein